VTLISSLTRTSVMLLALGLLSACGSLMDTDKVNYKSDGTAKIVPLDIPPDLTQLARDTRYAVPGGSVLASNMSTPQTAALPTTATAVKQINDVRLERDGRQRWLVVNRPAEAVWPIAQAFWKENGFTYTVEQEQLGLLETEWAENRAKIPQNFISRTLGKVFSGLTSSGTRDKFRTRLERNSAGGVDIYVTHRGMSEEYTDASKTRTMWQATPSDPELEAEFLSRLMIKLGVTAEQSKTILTAQAAPSAQVAIVNNAGASTLTLPDSFDVAWRRVGLALDRTGFTVEDRDRTKGIYFVRYVDTAEKEEKGFLTKLFSASTPEAGPVKYQIRVATNKAQTQVTVHTATGEAAGSTPVAARILKLLSDDLR
jgi:outer membrane protein assembly factor BamC